MCYSVWKIRHEIPWPVEVRGRKETAVILRFNRKENERKLKKEWACETAAAATAQPQATTTTTTKQPAFSKSKYQPKQNYCQSSYKSKPSKQF